MNILTRSSEWIFNPMRIGTGFLTDMEKQNHEIPTHI